MKADVYVSDVHAAINQPESAKAFAQAKLSVKLPSIDACQKQLGEFSQILAKVFINPRDVACRREEMSAAMDASMDLPIYKYDGKSQTVIEPPGSVMGIGAVSLEGGGINIVFTSRVNALVEVKNYFQSRLQFPIDLREVRITVNLINDTKSDLDVVAGAAFIGGIPYDHNYRTKIPPRRNVEARLSDVSSASVMELGIAVPFHLPHPPK